MFIGKLKNHQDLGLLILRIGIGIAFIAHGYPKLVSGPENWEQIGKAVSVFGIDFAPVAFGLMAALTEFLGGILLVIGLFSRLASSFLFCTMLVATAMHLNKGDAFAVYSHALEAAIIFLSLILIGPGQYACDGHVNFKKK